jgi:hypothetical protein
MEQGGWIIVKTGNCVYSPYYVGSALAMTHKSQRQITSFYHENSECLESKLISEQINIELHIGVNAFRELFS